MAALVRKKAFVAEQQRQLASMIAGGKDDAPPWKRPKVANASVTAPSPKAWTHWTCTCVMRNTHPVAHATCHRCGSDQLVMERAAIAKDKVSLRPSTAAPKAKVKPGNGAPAPQAATVYKFTSPPGPPPVVVDDVVM